MLCSDNATSRLILKTHCHLKYGKFLPYFYPGFLKTMDDTTLAAIRKTCAFLAFPKRQRLSRRGRTFFSDQNLGQVRGGGNTHCRECHGMLSSELSLERRSPLALAFAVQPVLALHLALSRPLLFSLLPLLALHLASTLCLIHWPARSTNTSAGTGTSSSTRHTPSNDPISCCYSQHWHQHKP